MLYQTQDRNTWQNGRRSCYERMIHVTSDSKILLLLNACRIALQVQTLSDISTIDSTSLVPSVHIGRIHLSNKFRRPKQKIPRSWWKQWSPYLTSYISCILDSHPLGPWLVPTHQTWMWLKFENYICGPNNQTFILTSSTTHQMWYIPTTCIPPPALATPVDIPFTKNALIKLSNTPIPQIPPPIPPTFSFTYLQFHFEYLGKGIHHITKYLKNSKLLVATDGSAIEGEKASFSFCLAKPSGKLL